MASISFSQFLYNSIVAEAHLLSFVSPTKTSYDGTAGTTAVVEFEAPADWVVGSSNGVISTPSGPYSSVATAPAEGQYFTVAADVASSTGFLATLSNAPLANRDDTTGSSVATSVVFSYN